MDTTNQDTTNTEPTRTKLKYFPRRNEELFGRIMRNVYDASSIAQHLVPGSEVAVVKLTDIYEFPVSSSFFAHIVGNPNHATVFVKDGRIDKVSAYSFKRKETEILPTKNFVQSGLIAEILDLLPEDVAKLQEEAEKLKGRKFLSCVNACMQQLKGAGFYSTSLIPLDWIVHPTEFERQLEGKMIMLRGKPVNYRIIRTTPLSMERYTLRVFHSQLISSTMWRHVKRYLDKQASSNKVAACLSISIKKFEDKFDHDKAGSRSKRQVAPALSEDVDYREDLNLRVSTPSTLGVLLRLIWNAHSLFEVRQARVNIEDFLPAHLQAFPTRNKSAVTWLKANILFNPLKIGAMRCVLAPHFVDLGMQSERDIYDQMRTHCDEFPNKYNIVIKGDSIVIGRLTVGLKWIDWIIAKHVLLSGWSKNVRFAGEIWKGVDGIIYVSGNSGTYRPTDEELDAAVAYLRAIFPHLRIEKALVEASEDSSTKTAPPEKSKLAKILTPLFAAACVLAAPLVIQALLASFAGINLGIQSTTATYLNMLNWVSAVLALLSGISFFMKDEGIRGMGRIVLGCCVQLLWAHIATTIVLDYSIPAIVQLAPSYIGAFVGLLAIGSGIHKYRRRNKPQS